MRWNRAGRAPARSLWEKSGVALLLGFALVAPFLANPLLSLFSIAVLAILWTGALRSSLRTVMAVYLSAQWLQAGTIVWLANFTGLDLAVPQVLPLGSQRYGLEIYPRTEEAVVLGLASIAMLSLGTRVFTPRIPPFGAELDDLVPGRLLLGYLALLIVELFAPPQGSGLAQVILAIAAIKYVFAALLAYVWIVNRRGALPLLVVVVSEVAIGLMGFFSGFKVIFIIIGTVCITLIRPYGRRVTPLIVLSGVVLVVLLTIWTAIKPDYRADLNKDSGSQAVSISVDERFQSLAGLVSELDASEFSDAVFGTLLRIEYTSFLADVLHYVPDTHPHEKGALWGETIEHMMAPRMFFPEKPVLASDSERTMRYTGRFLASDSSGASISIGYVGESYIDFGIAGALAIAFALGMTYGLIAKHIFVLARRRDLALCASVFIVLFLPVQQFEISNIKLFPSVVTSWVVFGLFVCVAWPMIRPLLTAKHSGAPVPARRMPVSPSARPKSRY
jgi:hypothetical protein